MAIVKYKDPKTGNQRTAQALHKVKKEGVWVIMAETKRDVHEFNYNEFSAINPGFKKKLTL